MLGGNGSIDMQEIEKVMANYKYDRSLIYELVTHPFIFIRIKKDN